MATFRSCFLLSMAQFRERFDLAQHNMSSLIRGSMFADGATEAVPTASSAQVYSAACRARRLDSEPGALASIISTGATTLAQKFG
jgi:hypothetical protein